MCISSGGEPLSLGVYYSIDEFSDLFPPESDEDHYAFSENDGVAEALQCPDQKFCDRNNRTRPREGTDDDNDRMKKRPRLSEGSE
jgi:hypothetical protein